MPAPEPEADSHGGKMSRFVTAETSEDNAAEKGDEWIKVQQELDANKARRAEPGTQEGGKSLYEVLEANKAAKQDAFEESIKLKNQFRPLDQDEVDFLDSVLETTRAKEAAIRQETAEALEHFRKQQDEVERTAVDHEGLDHANPDVAEEQSWAAQVKKRKKSRAKESLLGLKVRRTSSSSTKTDSAGKTKVASDAQAGE